MQVIPVIDLMGGVVVRARMGQRASYQPIVTPLSPTARALDVVAGLMRLHPFRTLYIADLDAIEGRGEHDSVLAELAAAIPGLEFWVDNGAADLARAEKWLGGNGGCLVLGSESQLDAGLVEALHENPRVILSLDFRGEGFVGPPALLARPELWPARVIVMTLARVGGGEGPDMERLASVLALAGQREVFAAGGLRGAQDLRALAHAGAAGVLVASALHDGRLGDFRNSKNSH